MSDTPNNLARVLLLRECEADGWSARSDWTGDAMYRPALRAIEKALTPPMSDALDRVLEAGNRLAQLASNAVFNIVPVEDFEASRFEWVNARAALAALASTEGPTI